MVAGIQLPSTFRNPASAPKVQPGGGGLAYLVHLDLTGLPVVVAAVLLLVMVVEVVVQNAGPYAGAGTGGTQSTSGTSGIDGTGSGGGGSYTGPRGGAGGSGIVLIAYDT